mmetsp:Transcript_8747/g.16920  ORF Transcript_8747/g.16920 Transcript_8747/m.16920 type:complete len:267 (+) Transcript_8747:17-817(+)
MGEKGGPCASSVTHTRRRNKRTGPSTPPAAHSRRRGLIPRKLRTKDVRTPDPPSSSARSSARFRPNHERLSWPSALLLLSFSSTISTTGGSFVALCSCSGFKALAFFLAATLPRGGGSAFDETTSEEGERAFVSAVLLLLCGGGATVAKNFSTPSSASRTGVGAQLRPSGGTHARGSEGSLLVLRGSERGGFHVGIGTFGGDHSAKSPAPLPLPKKLFERRPPPPSPPPILNPLRPPPFLCSSASTADGSHEESHDATNPPLTRCQ